MNNEQSNSKRKTPIIIWCVRLCLVAVIYFIGKFWLENTASAVTGQIVFSGYILLSSGTIIVSFIRSQRSLIVLIVSILIIPLSFFLAIDVSLNRPWWEWYMLAVQMGIPVVVAYYMWKAPSVRDDYSPNQHSQGGRLTPSQSA